MNPTTRIMSGLVLLYLGIFLYSKAISGSIVFYINARYQWFVLLAGIALFFIANVFMAYKAQAQHHHHTNKLGLLIMLIPVLLGLVVEPKPLGASVLGNREINIGSISSTSLKSDNTVALIPDADKRDILDWMLLFQRTPDPAAFDGQEASVTGFVYHDKAATEPNTFLVNRFVITCCVADATVVSLAVRAEDASTLEDDTWITVTGHFEAGEYRGKKTPMLIADEIKQVPPPGNPYLY